MNEKSLSGYYCLIIVPNLRWLLNEKVFQIDGKMNEKHGQGVSRSLRSLKNVRGKRVFSLFQTIFSTVCARKNVQNPLRGVKNPWMMSDIAIASYLRENPEKQLLKGQNLQTQLSKKQFNPFR